MSVEEFVAGVDRLLTRAHELFPTGGGGDVVAAGEPTIVAQRPSGISALSGGAARAGTAYELAQSAAAGLDKETNEGAAEGMTLGAQGRAASRVIRDGARQQAAALLPMSKSPAGMQLLAAAMGHDVAAMQRQLDTKTAENRMVATRLRQTAAGYGQIAGIADPAKPQTLDEMSDAASPRPAVQMTGYGIKTDTPSLPGGGAVPLDGGSTPQPAPPPAVPRPPLPLNHWSGHELGPQPVQSLPPAPPGKEWHYYAGGGWSLEDPLKPCSGRHEFWDLALIGGGLLGAVFNGPLGFLGGLIAVGSAGSDLGQCAPP